MATVFKDKLEGEGREIRLPQDKFIASPPRGGGSVVDGTHAQATPAAAAPPPAAVLMIDPAILAGPRHPVF